MERMLHRKLVGMNRVGELQGGMFFWVGGRRAGGGGGGSGFIMRQAALCCRAIERAKAFFRRNRSAAFLSCLGVSPSHTFYRSSFGKDNYVLMLELPKCHA